ncbi:hypothetical protein [Streptomyces sp. NPDC053560]|uniref:hypothetical protein n=1 Tax=Streptomyces sp. NPDC053560 TaxID=3365711 RepID=UPI0037D05147
MRPDTVRLEGPAYQALTPRSPAARRLPLQAFAPTGPSQWPAFFLTAAGWVFATTVAAGAARSLQRQ